MSEKTFTVHIYTPDKLVGTYDVTLLVCPAADGEIGVMADHMPMLCALKEGECRLTTQSGLLRLKVTDGLLFVRQNVAEIFCEK